MRITRRALGVLLFVAAGPVAAQQHTIPAGTHLLVRLDQELSTQSNRKGSRFAATLDNDIAIDGRVLLPRGTKLYGTITESKGDKRVDRSRLAATLNTVSVRGRLIPIVTDTVGADGKRGGGLAKVGAGTLIGAVFGSAGAGAAIGAGTAVLMKGSNIVVRAGTIGDVMLRAPVTLPP